jgi:soluble lytic murein transglycosylase
VPPAPPPTAPLIRHLLAAGLYDDAMNELRYAQKAWSTSPAIEATIAWIYHQKGDLRRGITLMRRAYPQFLSAGGDALPAPILQVIFPLTYWDAIKKNAAIYQLDPYIVAALIAQESTFDPNARSVANAWGLMQILPSTGRRLATALGIRRFTTSMLTNGETNIRLGTLYFKGLVQQFGGTYYALASYNAGENRIVRWKAERPGMDEDEFIDDIPFPETQNYVKRILGTAEDYRRLYGGGDVQPRPQPIAKATSSVKKPTTTRKPTARKPPAKKKTPPKRTPRSRRG